MITLKESILADMEDTISKGDKLADVAAKKELEKTIYTQGWYTVCNKQVYQKIYDYCIETTDKKGSRWRLVVPYIENSEDNLKPIMVSISSKKTLYRVPEEKELYGTTGSAMNKRIKKLIDTCSKLNLSNCFFLNTSYSSLQQLLYIINEYKFVGNVTNVTSNDWYTTSVSYFNKALGYDRQHVEYISFNFNTKEWGWGYNNKIPKTIIGYYTLVNTWDIISKNALYSDTPKDKITNIYSTILTKMDIVNIKSLKLDKGDVSDVIKNPSKNWIKIYIKEDYGKPITTYFYISKDGKSIVWEDDIKDMLPNKALTSSSNIQNEIKTIKGYRYNQSSISDELDSYIKNNYKKVNSYDDNQRWFKVHKSGNDAKYGSYMVCFDTKEWRNRTFDEFYGGGIVD